MRWEAVYDDGTHVSEGYAALDRRRLIAFSVEGAISVLISRGDTLVWRETYRAGVGTPKEFVKTYVALLHPNDTMDIWVAKPSGRTMEVQHGTSYDEVDVYPPALHDHEVPT